MTNLRARLQKLEKLLSLQAKSKSRMPPEEMADFMTLLLSGNEEELAKHPGLLEVHRALNIGRLREKDGPA